MGADLIHGVPREHLPGEMYQWIGVDPGAESGLVALDADGRYVESVLLDHDDGTATRDWLEERRDRIVIVGLEHSRPYLGNGVEGAFWLGARFSMVKTICLCLRIPLMLVDARKWQDAAAFSKPTKVTVADLDAAKYATEDPEQVAKMQDRAEKAAKAKTRARLKAAIMQHARMRWPTAPLSRKKDQAVADGLWIADYTRRHHLGESMGRERRERAQA